MLTARYAYCWTIGVLIDSRICSAILLTVCAVALSEFARSAWKRSIQGYPSARYGSRPAPMRPASSPHANGGRCCTGTDGTTNAHMSARTSGTSVFSTKRVPIECLGSASRCLNLEGFRWQNKS